MGLDMYLTKFVKVAGLDAEGYGKASELYISRVIEYYKSAGSGTSTVQLPYVDFEQAGLIPGSNILNLSQGFVMGDMRFPMLGIEAGYWRKANSIHAWFVRNVQNGEDDCKHYFVSKNDLEKLKDAVVTAIDAYESGNDKVLWETLPPQGGFFFGSTEIDEDYLEDLQLTLKIVDDNLASMKWDDEVLLYRASW